MAPSSKSERGGPGGKRGPAGAAGGSSAGPGPRGRREHVVRQLDRVKISGQLSPRLFRKLPPRVCVSLKSIVDEDFLCAGHIFLGFSKCGRYVLSYTSNSGDDDFSFYIYHLYWWEFNVHSKLKLVRQVRLFQDEEIYSDLYLTVCEWPSDSSKVIVFGFNTRSANGLLVNMMMMSDENHRDIYISAVAVPPPRHCPGCRDAALAHPGDRQAHCLRHGFMLHTKYQVVYPFPTFQPAFQLKKDQVVLLNTSYSLVACAVAVHAAEYEDDKISLPFVVTDLRGRSLKPLKERATAQGQYLTVEQLTLDFEYVINEVIRNDAAWSRQFCSFSDYDIVILEVCPETNQVIINIGLLLLAFPSPDEEGQLRPKTYHTSLKVAWDLNTGTFVTVSVGDLTEVKGQTSGSVWSSYRKGCVDTVMKWLVPESSGRYVNRMTNEALHKGCSLKVLADNERYTWIVL
ncbi:DDB1- and CUL4-associated factor 15 [Ciconia boyciana]|uniref:DDB1- and CUL4-associated factor 15 n=1 Tax=Ciconia boyciana TaxID=52775 RepID=UPI003B9ECA2C